MTSPRLAATDLDGTLLDAAGRVSARTREVLDELDRRGVPVVFVTGRPTRWVDILADAVGGHGLAICSNGAVVYDVAGARVRSAQTIPGGVVLEVADRLRDGLPGTTFALERTTGFARETAFRSRHAEPDGLPVGELPELLDEPSSVVKLLALHETIPGATFWTQVEALVGDQVTVTRSSSWALVEISAHGVTKASTLAALCDELGIAPAQVVAFGDMPNDVAMLAWAGSSYAMADAHPAVRAAAGAVAPAHDDDGVARVLSDLFTLT